MLSFTQFDGSRLELSKKPKRILSLVPSVTEHLIQIGVLPIGRTHFCIHPKEDVKDIPVVGGTKTLKLKSILDLKPDLVIANKEENKKEDIEALLSEGLEVWTTFPVKIPSVLSMMKEMAQLGESQGKSAEILKSLEGAMEEFHAQEERASVITLIWKNPWMAVGGMTYTEELLGYVGALNTFSSSFSRYPEVGFNEMAMAKPDLILLPSEPYEFGPTEASELKTDLAERDIFPRIELVLGESLTWPGPRTAASLEYFSKLLQELR